MNSYAQQYKSMEVNSSNRIKLIVMVYDAAIASLKEADDAHTRGDATRRNMYTARAQCIINDLNGCLDMSHGEIPTSLRSLYQFFIRHLAESLEQGATGNIAEVRTMMENLREGWDTICQQQAAEARIPSAGAAIYHGG